MLAGGKPLWPVRGVLQAWPWPLPSEALALVFGNRLHAAFTREAGGTGLSHGFHNYLCSVLQSHAAASEGEEGGSDGEAPLHASQRRRIYWRTCVEGVGDLPGDVADLWAVCPAAIQTVVRSMVPRLRAR